MFTFVFPFIPTHSFTLLYPQYYTNTNKEHKKKQGKNGSFCLTHSKLFLSPSKLQTHVEVGEKKGQVDKYGRSMLLSHKKKHKDIKNKNLPHSHMHTPTLVSIFSSPSQHPPISKYERTRSGMVKFSVSRKAIYTLIYRSFIALVRS